MVSEVELAENNRMDIRHCTEEDGKLCRGLTAPGFRAHDTNNSTNNSALLVRYRRSLRPIYVQPTEPERNARQRTVCAWCFILHICRTATWTLGSDETVVEKRFLHEGKGFPKYDLLGHNEFVLPYAAQPRRKRVPSHSAEDDAFPYSL